MTRRKPYLANLMGVLVTLGMGFPVYWMLTTSLKPKGDILSTSPTLWPESWTFANYSQALNREGFMQALLNSVQVVVVTVLVSMLVATFAAIAVARMRFRGRSVYVVSILLVQLVPLSALLLPLYLLLTKLNMVDSLPGLALTYIAFVLPFVVWTLRGFLVNIPVELEEAALVDGCNRPQAYLRVLFPLMAPGLVATAIFAFIQAWNEFLLAYILLSSQDKITMPVWLASFITRRGTEWGPLMAGSTLSAIPVVIFFMLIQDRIASGITAGAVKG